MKKIIFHNYTIRYTAKTADGAWQNFTLAAAGRNKPGTVKYAAQCLANLYGADNFKITTIA